MAQQRDPGTCLKSHSLVMADLRMGRNLLALQFTSKISSKRLSKSKATIPSNRQVMGTLSETIPSCQPGRGGVIAEKREVCYGLLSRNHIPSPSPLCHSSRLHVHPRCCV